MTDDMNEFTFFNNFRQNLWRFLGCVCAPFGALGCCLWGSRTCDALACSFHAIYSALNSESWAFVSSALISDAQTARPPHIRCHKKQHWLRWLFFIFPFLLSLSRPQPPVHNFSSSNHFPRRSRSHFHLPPCVCDAFLWLNSVCFVVSSSHFFG